MLGRGRGHVLAVRGLLAALALWAGLLAENPPASAQGVGQQAAQANATPQYLCCELFTENAASEAKASAAERDEARERDRQDLIAQQRMAEAAEDLKFWAVIQTVVGGVGAFLLAVTIGFSAAATKAAVKQARAADANLDVVKAQMRAHVTVEKASITGAREIPAQAGRIKADFLFINSGQTGARKVRILVGCSVQPYPLQGPLKLKIKKDAIVSAADIGREVRQEHAKYRHPMDEVEYRAFVEERVAVYAPLRVSYEDIFGHETVTYSIYFQTYGMAATNSVSPYADADKYVSYEEVD